MTIFSYVILEKHLHLVAQSDDIAKSMQKFKAYSAYELLKLLEKKNATTLLKQFSFHQKAHKTKSTYQIWEDGFHPKLIQSEAMMFEKINYIHQNPVKRGYIKEVMVSCNSNRHSTTGVVERGKVPILSLSIFSLVYATSLYLLQERQ